jgi:hypothetical protein
MLRLEFGQGKRILFCPVNGRRLPEIGFSFR